MFLISFVTVLLVSHPQLSHIRSRQQPSAVSHASPRPRTERLTGISPSSSCCFFLFLPYLLSILIASLPPPPILSIHPCPVVSLCAFIICLKEERNTLSPLRCLFPFFFPCPHHLLDATCA